MAPICEQQFFGVLQALEDYLAAQEALGAALKDGLFSIARGKYALGQELGEQRYPGDMQATSLISIVPAANPDALYDEFELLQPAATASCTQQHSEPCAQKGTGGRGANSRCDDGKDQQQQRPAAAACVHNHHGQVQHDPVSWFAVLPPPPVKQAQKDFSRALQQVVAAANALQRLRQHASDIQSSQLEQQSDCDDGLDAASDDAGS